LPRLARSRLACQTGPYPATPNLASPATLCLAPTTPRPDLPRLPRTAEPCRASPYPATPAKIR
jgi:hypothetical protein